MNKSRIWSCSVLVMSVILLIAGGAVTGVIDPFFHYHAPIESLSYPLSEQRYQNDGIIRNFSYDAMITGTSMTENFLASEFDELFGVHSVKVPFNGGTFKEIDDNIRRALKDNPDLRLVLRSVDGYMLAEDKDSMRTDAQYPEYLYDTSLWNDVSYVLNKEILLRHTMKVVQYTMAGEPDTSFDDYSFWGDDYTMNADRLLRKHSWDGTAAEPVSLTEEERTRVLENVEQNILRTARENPDVEFYCFCPPYSMLWWFQQYRNGTMEKQIEIYRIASEQMVQYDNIHLFSFTGEFAYIADLDRYLDLEHYGADMNSAMLQDMASGNKRLTEENNEAHWKSMEAYFSGFDYKNYFAAYGYPVTEE